MVDYLEKMAASRKLILPENILDRNNNNNNNQEPDEKNNDDDEVLGFLDLIKHRIIVRCALIGNYKEMSAVKDIIDELSSPCLTVLKRRLLLKRHMDGRTD